MGCSSAKTFEKQGQVDEAEKAQTQVETLRQTENPDYADAEQYIGSAINIAKFGVVNDRLRGPDKKAVPAISREPGYPILLSAIFLKNYTITVSLLG